jgi:hypothetical protein
MTCPERSAFKVSSRGWCYLLEQNRYVTKAEFDKAEKAINDCRRRGLLPVDFVAEEASRSFACVDEKSDGTVEDTFRSMLNDVLTGSEYYMPDWWEGESCYIQLQHSSPPAPVALDRPPYPHPGPRKRPHPLF